MKMISHARPSIIAELDIGVANAAQAVLCGSGGDVICCSVNKLRTGRVEVPVDLGYTLRPDGRFRAGVRADESSSVEVGDNSGTDKAGELQSLRIGYKLVAAEVGAGAVSKNRAATGICDGDRRPAGPQLSRYLRPHHGEVSSIALSQVRIQDSSVSGAAVAAPVPSHEDLHYAGQQRERFRQLLHLA